MKSYENPKKEEKTDTFMRDKRFRNKASAQKRS